MEIFVHWREPILATLLIMCRTGACLMMTPLLRRLPVPTTAATGIVLFVSIALGAAGVGPVGPIEANWSLVGTVLIELGIGLALGLMTLIVLEAFRLAGHMMGIAMGLAVAQIIDPGEGQRGSALATAMSMTAALIFILLDGHHMVIRTLNLSYLAVPIGAGQLPAGIGQSLATLLAASFAIGIRIAAPVMAGQMLVDVTSGILARSIPKMPIFFVAMPAKMLLSYGIAVVSLPVLSLAADHQIEVLERQMLELIRGM